MNKYTREQLLVLARLTAEDLEEVERRRRAHNRLGFAYQLAFMRVYNRFPIQRPSFEIDHELLTFVGIQLDITVDEIEHYHTRQPTLSRHQEQIRAYLDLRRFDEEAQAELEEFLFEEACRLEQMNALLARAEEFLREQGILQPAADTLRRLIVTQRQAAREHIYERITGLLSEPFQAILDKLLEVKGGSLTPFQRLKQPPGQASPKSMLKLVRKVERIEETGILAVDLSWLNNNYQRSLTRYAQRCSADRMRQLIPPRLFWQRLRENPLLLPVSLLASITIANTLLAADALLSLWGNYHRAQGLVTQLTYLLLFLVVSSRLRSLPQLQRLTTAMVATGIPIVLLGLAQSLGWHPLTFTTDDETLLYATLERSNFVGAYLALLLPLTLALTLSSSQRRWPAHAVTHR